MTTETTDPPSAADQNQAIVQLPWQPIEKAPKDRQVLLKMADGAMSMGRWDMQKHHKKPNPYWVSELGFILGVGWSRENPPTEWLDVHPAN